MSMGYGGVCRKVAEDAEWVIYEYAVYNWNVPESEERQHLFDGEIEIRKNALIAPEIREKRKRLPSGKRKTEAKRIIREIPFTELLEKEAVRITDCSHAWKKTEYGCDFIAYCLVKKIFRYYQEKDVLPETESCMF